MKAFYGKFKCRLCGKQFISMEAANKDAAIDKVVTVIAENSTTPMPDIYHNCEGGNIGIADFIGFTQERGECE